jgi:SAM-dependent methyltransferase
MRSTYRTLYRVGLTPWSQPTASGPLIAFADSRPPAVALDLGCGAGVDARYLAGLGWQVTAVDYVPRAIASARKHDRDDQVSWRVGDVTSPDQVDPDGALVGLCDLVIDNGCLHGIPPSMREGWAATVHRFASPGGVLLVRAAPPRNRGIGPAGIRVDEISALLGGDWSAISRPAPGWLQYQRPSARPLAGRPL